MKVCQVSPYTSGKVKIMVTCSTKANQMYKLPGNVTSRAFIGLKYFTRPFTVIPDSLLSGLEDYNCADPFRKQQTQHLTITLTVIPIQT